MRMALYVATREPARVLALREFAAVTDGQISQLASRFDLSDAWERFRGRFE